MQVEIAVATATLSYAVSSLLPGRGLHDLLVPGAIWKGPSHAVSLTFDDGPHPVWTPRVLDCLRHHGVRATFFLVGERAWNHPEIVSRIAAEGHEIGNHGWTHRSMLLCTAQQMAESIGRCQRTIARITGTSPRWLRPPFGRRDFRLYRVSKRLGLVPVLWSLDSQDWLRHDVEPICRRIHRAQRGDIVLMHDGRPDCAATVDALDSLLRVLTRAKVPTSLLQPPGAQCCRT